MMQNLKKRRVLCISNVPAPYTVSFYNELGKKMDLTVLFERVFASNRETEWFCAKENNFKAIYLNGTNFGAEAAICFNVIEYINHSYDLIIVANYSSPTGILAIAYLRIKRIPFYIHADGGMIAQEPLWKFKLKKLLISSANGYFSSGKLTDEYFCYYGKKSSNCCRYPFTSIRKKDLCHKAITSIAKKNSRKSEAIFFEDTVVLFVGRIIHGKGVDILIKAAKYLPNSIGINIIGGSPTKELDNLISSLGIKNIHFHPFMPFDMIMKYMRAADFFVFPTRYDVWGLVVNEALGQGLPVITTDKCLAGLELVRDGINGFIIPSENPKALAEKILYLHNNPEKLFEMSEQSLRIIEPYTIENMADVYANNIEYFCKMQDDNY